MSHDVQAAWAAAELANHFKRYPADCFESPPGQGDFSAFATREGKRSWPVADGVIKIQKGSGLYRVALEFKRANEGLHGMLTAVGQGLAYVHRGFSGAVIVIPKKYETHDNPGGYIRSILDSTGTIKGIGVFSYENPDVSRPSPFLDKLQCDRRIQLDRTIPRTEEEPRRVETQWAHLREGSSSPGAFYRYLQTAKRLSIESLAEPNIQIPDDLSAAVRRLGPEHGILKYLSNSAGDNFHDVVWRHFWYTYVFTEEVMPLWVTPREESYNVSDVPTRLVRPDGQGMYVFFSHRSDSIKRKLVEQLNSASIDENKAWEEYAKNVRNRAHSFREDVDSGLEHLGLLEQDGKPSDLGYKYVDACERTGDPNTGMPKAILGSALLNNGQLGAFLHYVYRLSESKFQGDPLSFSEGRGRENYRFNTNQYLDWLENELATNLCVMRKVSVRGGQPRKPFQGELAILRNFGFVGGFRIGVGLEVNWPSVQEAAGLEI